MAKPLHIEIKEKYSLGPAYHMTHLDNLSAILSAGAVQSYNLMRGKSYRNLSNMDVQQGRSKISVPPTGKPLHDFVPLYFGFKTPMVAWNQEHNEELVFLRFSLNVLQRTGVVIADGNARANSTKFQSYGQVDDLKVLNVKAILTVKYANDPELKRQKQAEILIPDSLPISELLDIICFSETAREHVLAVFAHSGIRKDVRVNPGWYFTDLKKDS